LPNQTVRDTARLAESVQILHEALAITPEETPLWLDIQISLGNAYGALGNRETGGTNRDKSIRAYQEALKRMTFEVAPMQWSRAMIGLGNALSIAGRQDGSPDRLKAAVTVLRSLLSKSPRERNPSLWANVQSSIGNALGTLGERENNVDHLRAAIAAFEEALKERTPERGTSRRAIVHSNLGNTQRILGERLGSSEILEEAIRSILTALSERTREKAATASRHWARHQFNLGKALFALGTDDTTHTTRLREALEAYQAAATVRTRENGPIQWAATQTALAEALAMLGEREASDIHLNQAVDHFRAVIDEKLIRTNGPMLWAGAQFGWVRSY
jgi:hypothetical protein